MNQERIKHPVCFLFLSFATDFVHELEQLVFGKDTISTDLKNEIVLKKDSIYEFLKVAEGSFVIEQEHIEEEKRKEFLNLKKRLIERTKFSEEIMSTMVN